jgi:UDP-2-acetamido-3-amino-2,3-dideoxy-glucuronate N-acetyltransferase
MTIRIHPTTEVAETASIGDGTSIWHHCQIRPEGAIGQNCILGKGVYVDADAPIGDNVKIQNYVSVYHGVTLENGVFVGPHVCFTNDLRPRAINVDGSLKAADDWILSETRVKKGAALGANSTIRCSITIGEWAMIGSGSVVTRDVPDYGLVFGNPARLRGFVCPCGTQVIKDAVKDNKIIVRCPECGATIEITQETWEKIR